MHVPGESASRSRRWCAGRSALLAFWLLARSIPSLAFVAPPEYDASSLTEIRHLDALPREVAATLGWRNDTKDTIADLEENAHRSRSVEMMNLHRWYIVGGANSNQILIAYEDVRPYPRSTGIHAKAFSLTPHGWMPEENGDWILPVRPHTIGELLQLLNSSEVKALTQQWQAWQQQQADMFSQFDESAARSARGLRYLNISDTEVREIQAIVLRLNPGAIVMIGGVMSGCPCADGPNCSAQVSVATHNPQRTSFVELSDIDGHWSIGPMQQWYFDRDKLEQSAFPSNAARSAALQALSDRYPACSNARPANRGPERW